MKPELDVSVISANYNNGQFLKSYLDSLHESDFLPREIIIIDDGSTDDSVEQVEHYNSSRVKLIKFLRNRGFAHALNEGIALASSKYIMRLDPDDYIESTRIGKQFRF